MTIEQLALATQKEFQIIHDEFRTIRTEMRGMATKAEVAELREGLEKVNRSIADLHQLVEKLAVQVSVYITRTNEDIRNLQAADKDLDLRLRMMEERR
ncbi:MAG TPA: hypothetical protein VMA75_04030 [Candidatus Paceibacterota bacterium]|nr:hypothetical protein [Candidatus Paceibacterota bacterium]